MAASLSTIDLTNLIVNGGFEANMTGWNGYNTNNQNAQVALNPTQQNVSAPVHGENGSKCLQIGTKTQGVVYVNPSAPISTTIGHQYYIKARVRLRGITAGLASVCTVVNGAAVPQKGTVAPTPLASGLQTTNVNDWVLLDSIWEADVSSLNPQFIWQTTANQGNNDIYGLLDNVVMIDLTDSFGIENEPPLFAIREGVSDNGGHWDGTFSVEMAVPPEIVVEELPVALKGRNYSALIGLEEGKGTEPFTFAISGLPVGHGLIIDSDGLLTGVCNLDEGQYVLTITVTDSIGYKVSHTYDLYAGEPPVINNAYIPGAVLDLPYSFTPDVDGSDGNLTVSISVTGGTLPTGLSISGGTISGTPSVDGQSCQITITAYNDYDQEGVSKVFTLGVFSAPHINTTSPLRNATLDIAYSLTFTASGVTPIEWELLSGSLPAGLELYYTGVLSGTPEATGTYSFSVKATNELGSDTQLFTLSVYQLPAVTTTSFGYARLGSPYSGQLTATGSTPITWSITNGSLPTGLSLNASTGAITGTPLATGTFTFTVVASNIVGNSTPVTLSIEAGFALAIVTNSPLPNGTVNAVYTSLTFQVDGVDGSFPVTWAWAAQAGSSLPPGLSFNATTGVLSGTPSAIGTYNVNVTVTNGSTNSTSPFSITVGAPPAITTDPVLAGGIDRPFTIVLNASGTTPITWSMTSGPTPSANIQLSSGGVLSWLIPAIGTYSFTVVATNTFGNSTPVTFSLTITTPSIIDVDLDNGIVGEAYQHTFTAGGDPPFTWSLVSGSLPSGLSFDPVTATLSGTPSATGNYAFSLKVSNVGGFAQEAFTLTIVSRPVITTAALNSGNVGASYLQTLQATGTTPITWAVLSPAGLETGLPPGLSLSGATISGTPTTQGIYTFSVRASNTTGLAYADVKLLTITVGPSGAPIITTGAALSAIRGTAFSQTLAANGNTPITWSLDGSSTLPDGLAMVDNVLSGTPTVGGTYSFIITATNSAGSDLRTFVMTVRDPPVITTSSIPDATINQPYSEALTATGDTPISWQVMTPAGLETGLPSGLLLDTVSGILSGFPDTTGYYTFRIRASNNAGNNTLSFSMYVLSDGGTYLHGKEVERLFIKGREIERAYINGVRIF